VFINKLQLVQSDGKNDDISLFTGKLLSELAPTKVLNKRKNEV